MLGDLSHSPTFDGRCNESADKSCLHQRREDPWDILVACLGRVIPGSGFIYMIDSIQDLSCRIIPRQGFIEIELSAIEISSSKLAVDSDEHRAGGSSMYHSIAVN